MRESVHRLIGVLFWGILIALWAILVLDGQVTLPTLVYSVGYVAVVSGAVLAVTAWWIRHNMGIYRRKGPRRGRPSLPPRVDQDRLGRPVHWKLRGGSGAATEAGHLVVELRGPVKVYRRAS